MVILVYYTMSSHILYHFDEIWSNIPFAHYRNYRQPMAPTGYFMYPYMQITSLIAPLYHMKPGHLRTHPHPYKRASSKTSIESAAV